MLETHQRLPRQHQKHQIFVLRGVCELHCGEDGAPSVRSSQLMKDEPPSILLITNAARIGGRVQPTVWLATISSPHGQHLRRASCSPAMHIALHLHAGASNPHTPTSRRVTIDGLVTAIHQRGPLRRRKQWIGVSLTLLAAAGVQSLSRGRRRS